MAVDFHNHLIPGVDDGAQTIDGRGKMVMPGLVNIHSHPSSEAMTKGWNDELGSPKMYGR